jgi:hypothetical protein
MPGTLEIVAEVNDALGADYQLVRRLAGGLQGGAFELRGGDSTVVLKWNSDTTWAPRVFRAAELVRKARAVWYPTLAWLAVGTTSTGTPYQLQDSVEGQPLVDASTVDLRLAEELVEIVEDSKDWWTAGNRAGPTTCAASSTRAGTTRGKRSTGTTRPRPS